MVLQLCVYTHTTAVLQSIEVLNLNPRVFPLLVFTSLPNWPMLCSSPSSSVRLFQKPSGNNGVAKAIRYYMAWQSRRAKRQIMRPSPSSSAEEIVDQGQRARVAGLDGAGLSALDRCTHGRRNLSARV